MSIPPDIEQAILTLFAAPTRSNDQAPGWPDMGENDKGQDFPIFPNLRVVVSKDGY